MATLTNPTGSESWAGFANEDASAYPFTFGEGGSITFMVPQTVLQQMSTSDLKNPYPDTEPSYNTEVVTLGADSADYTVNIPSTENSFSSLLYVTTTDLVM